MGVLAVLAVIITWRYTIKGKGVPAARLAALLGAIIIAWVTLDIANPHSGGIVASGFAAGIEQAATGFGHFFSHFK
jgi:hypothetical protein